MVNKILNLTALSLTFIAMCFLLPPFLFVKFIMSVFSSFFPEDVAGKVVLITGASSGIGEHIAYEYARRGARLALVARRQHLLQNVADICNQLGTPDVIVIPADVSKVEDCRRFITATVNHFGRLDHLVCNAGIATICMLEEFTPVTNAAPVIETNFWGSVYSTHFAIPHLRQSMGKIIVIASAAAWLPVPRLAFYSASKAALVIFFETLRVELGRDIGITIVTPGLTESELTKGKFLSKEGKMVLDQEMRDVEISVVPVQPVEKCAKDTVDSACCGAKYLTVPSWLRATILWKLFVPQAIEWCTRILLVTGPETSPTEALSKKILDLTGLQKSCTRLQSNNRCS